MGLGLFIPIAISQGRDTTYLANVRILMPASATDQTGGTAADTVAAIATSRTEVAAALHDAGAARDPSTYGANHVSVQPVGASGIIDLSVTDTDPRIAAAVANSLTGHVVEEMSKASSAQQQKVVDELTADIAAAGARIEALARQANGASPSDAASLDARRSLVLQDRANMESQLAQLQGQLAGQQLPSVIDSASPSSAIAIPPTRRQDVVLAALFGLVIGLATAALLEALNPTVMGEETIAAELGVPVLGVLPSTKLSALRWRLEVQAKRTGVQTIELTTAGPRINLAPLSAALHSADGISANGEVGSDVGSTSARSKEASGNGPSNRRSVASDSKGRSLAIQVLDEASTRSFDPGLPAGVVIVVPTAVKRGAIEPVKGLLRVTDWPALGLIAYRRLGFQLRFKELVGRAKAFRPWGNAHP